MVRVIRLLRIFRIVRVFTVFNQLKTLIQALTLTLTLTQLASSIQALWNHIETRPWLAAPLVPPLSLMGSGEGGHIMTNHDGLAGLYDRNVVHCLRPRLDDHRRACARTWP